MTVLIPFTRAFSARPLARRLDAVTNKALAQWLMPVEKQVVALPAGVRSSTWIMAGFGSLTVLLLLFGLQCGRV